MSRCSILIVEDDPGAAESLVPMLTSHGYDVRVAVDAEKGFQEIALRRPTVLLVDLHLPIVNGLEFLRHLRRNVDHADVPVAMMTGDYLLDDGVIGELKTLGAPLYFKPLWEEDLVGLVQQLLERAGEISGPCGKVPISAGAH